ncbi:MAG: APC family permease, partial [Gammaproteobacteria bacterium]
FAAGELKKPEQDLPFAMIIGTLAVIVLYLLANVAYLSVLSPDAIAHAPQDRVATAAMQAMFGETGLYLMAGAIIISTLGCNNGLILAGARVYYAMAQDHLFFKSIGTLHPQYHTPALALILQAVWTSVLCLSGTYSQLLEYVVFAAVLFYVLTSISLFLLRVKRPEQSRPVRVIAYPWVPALYLVLTALTCINLLYTRTTYSGLGLLIVLSGVPVYFIWKMYRDSA